MFELLPAFLNAEDVLCQWDSIGYDMAEAESMQEAVCSDVMPSLQVGHSADSVSLHEDVTGQEPSVHRVSTMASIKVFLVAQRRAELAMRLVRTCGPPAAQGVGCSTVNLLLQLAARVAQLQCASTPP